MFRKSIFIFFIICFCLLNGNLSAQVSSLRIGMPSPTAASLGKYGDIPVSLYTGTPNISIPLYEVKGRYLSVPITLTYHASGVKVEEIASWVGLGWSLNAGGVITRTLKGIPDEKYGDGYHYTGDELDDMDVWAGNDQDYLDDVNDEEVDSEPDRFFFNFAGRSGQFILAPNSAVNDTIQPIPYQQMIITKEIAADEITKWTIITEDGTRYTFDQKETTYDITLTEGDITNKPDITFAASWYLTKIESAAGKDSIRFTYKKLASRVTHDHRTFQENKAIDIPGLSWNSQDFDSTRVDNQSKIYPVYLESIVSSQDSIWIERGSRDDLSVEQKLDTLKIFGNGTKNLEFVFKYNYFSNGSEKRLRLDSLFQYGSGTESLPPYKFEYNTSKTLPNRDSNGMDYWGFYNGKSNGNLLPSYEDALSNVFLPGADRRPYADFMIAGVLEKIWYPTGGYTKMTYEPHDYSKISDDGVVIKDYGTPVQYNVDAAFGEIDTTTFTIGGSSDELVCLIIRLNMEAILPGDGSMFATVKLKIDGGSTIKTWSSDTVEVFLENMWLEPDDYLFIGESEFDDEEDFVTTADAFIDWETEEDADKIIAGGLRIQRIESHDGMDAERDIIKEYEYRTISGSDTLSTGVLVGELKFSSKIPDPDNPSGQSFIYRTSASRVPLGMTNGSHIGYSQVTVLYGEDGEFGKSIHKFRSPLDSPDQDFDGNSEQLAGVTTYDWKRGQETSAVQYDSSGAIQQGITRDYTFTENTLPAVKIRAMAVKWTGEASINVPFDKIYHTNPYEIISGWAYQNKETVTFYTGSDSVTTSATYFYDKIDHAQVTRIREVNSDGTKRFTFMKYPHDYPTSASGVDSTVAAIHAMKDSSVHIINAVIEKVVGDSLRTNVYSAELVKYKEFNTGQFLPYQKFLLDADAPVTGFDTSKVDTGPTPDSLKYDADYILRETFVSFDTFGNLLKATNARGTENAVIWGYDDNLPLATAANANGEEFGYNGFEEGLAYGWAHTSQTVTYSDAFIGDKVSKVCSTCTGGQYGPTQDFKEVDGLNADKGFKATVWVKGIGTTTAYLSINVNNGSPNQYTYYSNSGDWELLEASLTKTQIESAMNGDDYIRVFVANNDVDIAYFDELRFYPDDGSINNFNFDADTRQLIAKTDANNIPTHYEYDEFNRLSRVMGPDKNIISENSYYFSRDGNADTLNASDPNFVGTAQFSNGIPKNEMAGYWRFEGNASDASCNSNDGTINGATPIAGFLGRGFDFDGTNDYIDAGNDATLTLADSITVAAWVWHDSGNGHVVNRGGGWSDYGYSMYWYSSKIRIELQKSGEKTILDITQPSNGAWHHLAFTWDIISKKIYVYIDGVKAGSSATFNGPIGTPSQNLNIGRNQLHSAYFNGKIDEVQIFNRALSEDEIKSIANPLVSTTFIDGLGREIQSHSRNGDKDIITHTTYNNRGEAAKQYKPKELTNSNHTYSTTFTTSNDNYELFEYFPDPLNRIKKQTHSDDNSISFDYGVEVFNGQNFRFEKLTDETGKISKTYFDKFGNQAGSRAAAGTSDSTKLAFTYNMLGNPDTLRPPNYYDPPSGTTAADWESQTFYNTLGQVYKKSTPDEGTAKYIYDSNGNLRFSQTQEQANGGEDLTFYQYDLLNRLVLVGNASSDATIPAWNNLDGDLLYLSGSENFENVTAHPANLRYQNFYDLNYISGEENFGQGRLTKVEVNTDSDVAPEHITTYLYDKLGNVIEERITIDGLSEKIVFRSYDLLGRETELTYPSGTTVVKQYDNVGRIKKIYTIN